MAGTTPRRPFADRLERVGDGKRVTSAELEDLAGYAGEIEAAANELECKFADFAASTAMLADPDTPRGERAGLRAQLTADAGAAAAALRELAALCF